ncbi:MAG: MiaB/RimO family radical SAM methylthiotransferase, partial [Candidatus Omnitrophota bacterium]
CNNFCSFCKVPLVRGRSKSRPPEEVISEFSRLVKSGYKEIILCGICLGSWGMDPGFKLDRLLGEIELKAKGDYRIRLSSIEPWYVTDGLIKKAAGSKKICPHLHIPLQSGDDNILKRMNRRYSPSDFKRLVKKIRDTMPEIAFTTDILVGFPGETDKAFDNTLKTIEVTKPSRAHIFPYSPRKGTRAYGFGDLPGKETVNKRIKKLKALTDMLALEYRKGFEGKSLQVLVEDKRDPQTGLLTGYTDNYIRVILPGSDNLMGKFINTPLP